MPINQLAQKQEKHKKKHRRHQKFAEDAHNVNKHAGTVFAIAVRDSMAIMPKNAVIQAGNIVEVVEHISDAAAYQIRFLNKQYVV